jgi:ankyrin repeat protein
MRTQVEALEAKNAVAAEDVRMWQEKAEAQGTLAAGLLEDARGEMESLRMTEYDERITSAAKTAAEGHRRKHEQMDTNEPVWDAQAWFAAEGCAVMLEQVLLGPLKKVMEIDASENVGTVELELIRAIAKEKDTRAVVMSLLERSKAMQQITVFITSKMEKLLEAAAESGPALNLKFVEEYDSVKMAFGGQESFFQGLDGLIGPPNPNLQEGMRSEHCQRKDSSVKFTTHNYGITTTSHVEYLMVVEPLSIYPERKKEYQKLELPSDIQKLKADGKLPRSSSGTASERKLEGVRFPKPPSEFTAKMAAIVEQLEDRNLDKLQLQEFHAARLYTGPTFMKYNAVLRGLPKLVDHLLFQTMQELCQDNRYVTTLHCINSAIVKMGRLATPQTVYRGISGRVLPDQFWRGAGHGGVEFAFMSTTTDRKVAMQYAKQRNSDNKAATVMEIKMGMIDRGADLAWLSQYPDEHEITFPPFTGLEVADTRVDENVLVVNMRLNVNLTSPTIEASVAKMRSAHLQLLETIHSNLRTAHAPQRLLLSLKGLLGAEKGKDPDFFNHVENFHSATEMALDTQHEAFIALHEKSLWEREFKAKEMIPDKMRLAAGICARVGEHEVALSLLRQAWDRDHPPDTKSCNYRGQMILAKSSVFWQEDALTRLDDELNDIIKEHLKDVREDEMWKLALAVRLVQIGIPSPWPATLCRLATATNVTESTSELSESLATSNKMRDAIIEVVKLALKKQLATDDFKFGEPVGLKGLSKGAQVRVLVTSQVGDTMSQVWRKAKAKSTWYGGLIAKEGAAGRTIIVDLPKGGQPPTITLQKGMPGMPSYSYQVQWAIPPEPGEYVISELADGGQHGDVKLAQKAGSEVVGSFSNPPEAYLTVEVREGSGTRDYSAAQIARGEVLISPAPNPTVSSGAGALLREAAATGNVELLQALLDVGVSVWEADPTATTAVHLAASNRQEKTFELLWKVEPTDDPLRVKLVGPTLVHLTLRNNDYKRPLDFIFESGSSKLARMTRPDALDEEMKLLEETEQAALKWTDELLEVERKAIGEYSEYSSEVLRMASRGSSGSDGGSDGGSDKNTSLSKGRSSPVLIASHSFRSPEDQAKLRDVAGKVTAGGVTALMLASRLEDLSDAYACVRALLIAKADPARPTEKNKMTALHVAAEMGHHSIVEMLAKNLGQGNVDLKMADGKTALMLACKNGHAESAEELLKFGAEPSLQEVFGMENVDGFSAIMHAALYCHDECIAVVLRHEKKVQGDLGELLDLQNKNGDTGLHLASLFGQRKVVQLLLRERADVNALNKKGETALHNASQKGHAQVACALLTGGAEVDKQDRDHGYSALHYCCISNGGKDVADALMEVGAKVGLVGIDGNTPLHLACMSGNHRVVDAMMKRKAAFRAAVAVRNGKQEFPFDAARKAGHDNVKEKLQPIRHNLESHMSRINTVQQFKAARAFVRDIGVQRLKHELIAPGFVDPKTYRLTTTKEPFNVFAMVGAGKIPANKEDNEALKKANPAYAERFMVARNLPDNDTNWNSSDPAYVGKASMSKRHRFMIIKKPSDTRETRAGHPPPPEEARMTYFWTWFNVLTMGLVDGFKNFDTAYDEDAVKKMEADPELNKKVLMGALQCLKTMRDAALAFVEQDRKEQELRGAEPEDKWSEKIGLFFHCYPRCSVNSTHMHIVDLDYTGPTFDKINNEEGRNLRMEDVIKAVEEEIEHLETELRPVNARNSARVLAVLYQ